MRNSLSSRSRTSPSEESLRSLVTASHAFETISRRNISFSLYSHLLITGEYMLRLDSNAALCYVFVFC